MKLICFGFLLFLTACAEDAKQTVGTTTQNNNVQITDEDRIVTGKSIFLQKCAPCHSINMNLTGPALKGVTKRWDDKAKLYDYIRNSQEVIAKNEYAKALFNRWNRVPMPPFTYLTDEDINSILMYIKSGSSKKQNEL